MLKALNFVLSKRNKHGSIILQMLEYLLDKRLSPSLGTLYGPHLTCHLSLVQAHLMVSLAGTIHVLPDQEDVTL